MPEYRTPIPGIMAGLLESAVNRVLSLDDGSADRLKRLSEKQLQLVIEGIGITLNFVFSDERVRVSTRPEGEPDTVIAGSPVALFSMAAPEGVGAWGTDDSRVTITGDANLARDLERLFSRLDPDWEGGLSRVFGDVWGHQVASGLKTGAGRARQAATEAGEMIDEYLTQGQGPVIHQEEFAGFSESVDDLGDSLDRAESLLAGLEARQEDAS